MWKLNKWWNTRAVNDWVAWQMKQQDSVNYISLVGWATRIVVNSLYRINIRGSVVIAKAEELIWTNSGTTSFIPPMIYARCQMFCMEFLLMPLFMLGLADETISVLRILIIGFSCQLPYVVNYTFPKMYLKKNWCIRDWIWNLKLVPLIIFQTL